jgi:hypothetical protein
VVAGRLATDACVRSAGAGDPRLAPWDSGVPATGEDAMWLGPSCGGLQIRAAVFEPRIRRVIAMPASYSGPDMPNRHL